MTRALAPASNRLSGLPTARLAAAVRAARCAVCIPSAIVSDVAEKTAPAGRAADKPSPGGGRAGAGDPQRDDRVADDSPPAAGSTQRDDAAKASDGSPSAHAPSDRSPSGASPSGDGGGDGKGKAKKKPRRKRSWWRVLGILLMLLVVAVVAARLALPRFLVWYVNRTIDQNPMYDGKIRDIDVHLLRGSYSINDIRLLKTTGNVPVPLFAAKRVDLAIEWDALMHRKIVGRIVIDRPELNFVDAGSDAESQTGGTEGTAGTAAAGGPWLEIIQDLFPFRINSCLVRDGSVHFRAFDRNPPVDVYLSHLDASLENLTNVRDEVTPMIATVKATALAMDHAKFEYQMQINPFSYRPTFQMATRLVGLDVTKLNELARSYGGIDFEHGFFDLVVEMDAKEGALEGYVKPMFRSLKVLTLSRDIKEDNPIEFFWEAVVGVAHGVLKNQARDQLATLISFRGAVDNPKTSILQIVGNVLRNGFIRAYLPRLQGVAEDIDRLEFGKGSVTEPKSMGND